MKKHGLMLLVISFMILPLAKQTNADPEAYSLTLDEAVQWALGNSHDLKMAEQEIKRSEINKDNAAENLTYIPVGRGNGQEDAAARSALKSSVSADISLQMSKKELEVTRDQIQYRIRQAYQDILLKENELKNKEEAYELAKMEEEIALAKSQIGRISKVGKNEITKARVDAEENVQMAKTALQEAQVQLNILMGKPKENIYHLVDKPEYTKPETLGLDFYITRMRLNSPTIWLLEKQVELAELDITLFTYNAGQSYELTKMDVQRARDTLTNSKEQGEEFIRNTYSTLKQLEDQYLMQERNLQAAKDSLQLAQEKLGKGLVTAVDVKREEMNVNQLMRALDETVIKMDQLLFTLNKPWV